MGKSNNQKDKLKKGAPGKQDDPTSGDVNEPIRILATRLRDTFETKDWQGLQSLLAFPTVWVENAAFPVSEFAQKAQAALGDAEDIEFVLSRVLQTEIGATSGRASLTARLSWSAAKTWEETAIEFDLHLGFEKAGEDWRISFLGVTSTKHEPEAQGGSSEYFGDYFGAYFQGVQPQYFEAAAVLNRYFQGFPLAAERVGRYFGESFAASPYFGAAAIPPPPAPPPPGAPPRMVLCYMPVLLPADVARSIFKPDS